MSYADMSSTRSWSVGTGGVLVVGLSSSNCRLVEMSMQFASARLVSGGDGIGVSDRLSDGDSVDVGGCPLSGE
jgi:hypothetical protein